MPCIRNERQRPRFDPIALPARPVIPVGDWNCYSKAQGNVSQNSQISVATTGKQVDRPNPPPRSCLFCADEIVRGLFLGTSADAVHLEDLERHNIRNILNVASECEFTEEQLQAQARGTLTLRKVHMVDHSDHDITKAFPECVVFILNALQRGEGVLVHCRMGVSRSASVVIAFLMQYGGVYFPSKQRNFEARAAAAAASKSHTPRATMLSYACESPQVNTNPHRVSSRDNIAQDAGSKSPSATSVYQQQSLVGTTAASSCVAAPQSDLLRQCNQDNKTFPMTYGDAFDIVKEHRCQVAPNLGFCLALREIDVERGVLSDIWDFSDSVCL